MLKYFKKYLLLTIVIVSGLCTPLMTVPAATSVTPASRPYLMGFTRWPPDFTVEGMATMDRFIEDHADLVALHLDNGIPWPEALAGQSYSPDVEKRLSYRPPQGKKLYVAVTPLNFGRDGLAAYWGTHDGMPLPAPWNMLSMSAPQIKQAYVNFLFHLVDKLHPDFLNIGIEANLLIEKAPEKWAVYMELHKYAFKKLKVRYPHLPVFVSIEVLHLNGLADKANKQRQYKLVKNLMAYSDYFGMSLYPYMSWDVPSPMPDDFLDFATEFGRPVVVAESGYSSRNVMVSLVPLFGSKENQARFISRLLEVGVRDRYVFIINFASTDFEKLIKKLPGYTLRQLAGIWKYTGLQTSSEKPKPALIIWDRYYRLPFEKRWN